MPLINLSNIKISEKFLGTPRIEPRAAGREAQTLPLWNDGNSISKMWTSYQYYKVYWIHHSPFELRSYWAKTYLDERLLGNSCCGYFQINIVSLLVHFFLFNSHSLQQWLVWVWILIPLRGKWTMSNFEPLMVEVCHTCVRLRQSSSKWYNQYQQGAKAKHYSILAKAIKKSTNKTTNKVLTLKTPFYCKYSTLKSPSFWEHVLARKQQCTICSMTNC